MKPIRSLLLSGAVFAATMTAHPYAAWALFGGGGFNRATETTLKDVRNKVRETRDAVRDTKKAVNEVRQEVRESTDRIIAALRMQAGENSAYQDKQIEANRRITDAAQQNDTQRLRQEFRARAESGEFDPSPDICLLAGLFRGNGESGAAPARGSTLVGNAAALNSGSDPAVRAGGTVLSRSLIDDQRNFAGLLDSPDPTTDPGVFLENPSLPEIQPGSEEDQALSRLVRNLTDPLPPRPVTDQEMRTPEGVARAAAQAVRSTRSGAAGEVVSMILNMKDLVQPVTAEGFQAYHDDIANYNRPWPGVGKKISELQAIDIRTLRYYAPKPELFHKRATYTERQLLQELLDAVSIQNRIAYMQLELDTRTAIVNTQILTALNE